MTRWWSCRKRFTLLWFDQNQKEDKVQYIRWDNLRNESWSILYFFRSSINIGGGVSVCFYCSRWTRKDKILQTSVKLKRTQRSFKNKPWLLEKKVTMFSSSACSVPFPKGTSWQWGGGCLKPKDTTSPTKSSPLRLLVNLQFTIGGHSGLAHNYCTGDYCTTTTTALAMASVHHGNTIHGRQRKR